MIPARAVMVAKLFHARCCIDGCLWAGPPSSSYQEANRDRQAHLDWHRQQEVDAILAGGAP